MTWQQIAREQAGVLTRRQLNECGIDADAVRHRVQRGRWQAIGPTIVVVTSGELSPSQRRWVAVLHVSPTGALSGLTACESHGLTGWHRDQISVLVVKNAAVNVDLPGVSVQRTRRPTERMLAHRSGPPTLRLEPAALLHAGSCRSERESHGLLAACVQQRLTTAERLLDELSALAPLRRAAGLRRCLAEIATGAGSRSEMDVADMCRDHGLTPPARQVRRRDARGRVRFTDCEWNLTDGRVVILEVDGGFHMDLANWEADIQRTRRILDPRTQLIRATSRELRDEPWAVAADLVRLGVPHTHEVGGSRTAPRSPSARRLQGHDPSTTT